MIRAYKNDDLNGLLNILRLNTPTYFHPSEEKDYLQYLMKHAQNYYIIENSNQIIAAGGINYGFDEGKTARLSWDLIHPDYQRKGYGTTLSNYRINKIKQNPHIENIIVRTSQKTYAFYEKIGFKLESSLKDFWADGMDLYVMKIEIKK